MIRLHLGGHKMLGKRDDKKNHGPKHTESDKQDKNIARAVMDHQYQGCVRFYLGECD